MTDQEASDQFRCECPRCIAGILHLLGYFSHYTRAGRPGRVICLDTQGTIYPSYSPTQAQEYANQARKERRRREEEEEEEEEEEGREDEEVA